MFAASHDPFELQRKALIQHLIRIIKRLSDLNEMFPLLAFKNRYFRLSEHGNTVNNVPQCSHCAVTSKQALLEMIHRNISHADLNLNNKLNSFGLICE